MVNESIEEMKSKASRIGCTEFLGMKISEGIAVVLIDIMPFNSNAFRPFTPYPVARRHWSVFISACVGPPSQPASLPECRGRGLFQIALL